MAKQKHDKIKIYKTSSGQEICRVNLNNKERPVKFSDLYRTLKNAGYTKKSDQVYQYKTSKGLLICEVDFKNSERPVKFSSNFPSLKNAAMTEIETENIKQKEDDENKEEVVINAD